MAVRGVIGRQDARLITQAFFQLPAVGVALMQVGKLHDALLGGEVLISVPVRPSTTKAGSL